VFRRGYGRFCGEAAENGRSEKDLPDREARQIPAERVPCVAAVPQRAHRCRDAVLHAQRVSIPGTASSTRTPVPRATIIAIATVTGCLRCCSKLAFSNIVPKPVRWKQLTIRPVMPGAAVGGKAASSGKDNPWPVDSPAESRTLWQSWTRASIVSSAARARWTCWCDRFPLDHPIAAVNWCGSSRFERPPAELSANSSIAMARLGLRAAGFTYLGDDDWGTWCGGSCKRGRRRKSDADASDRAHHVLGGARRSRRRTQLLPIRKVAPNCWIASVPPPLDCSPQSHAAAGLLSVAAEPAAELPEVLARIARGRLSDSVGCGRRRGGPAAAGSHLCHTWTCIVRATPKRRIRRARQSSRRILGLFADCGAPGLLGVKLGAQGALLSPERGVFVSIPAVPPPGPVVDTTGAGDVFYAACWPSLARSKCGRGGPSGGGGGACVSRP